MSADRMSADRMSADPARTDPARDSGTEAAYWCELAWLPPGTVRPDVLVRVQGSRIVAVEAGTPDPPRQATRLAGLTLPGLANAHSHAFHRALRGRTQRAGSPAGPGSFWTWRDQMYDVAARLDPGSYAALARAVYAEMALAGITCVGEFHYVHHRPDATAYDEPNLMADVLVAAARAAGLRITLLDTCYLTGGIATPLSGVQRRFGDGDARGWAGRADLLHRAYAGNADVVIGAAAHSIRAVPPLQMETVARWAGDRHAPLHVHVSEQRRENDECLAAYGTSPTRRLAEHGVLGPRTTVVHATHVEETDIALLADTGTTACLCPTTERDLADGIGPAGALSAAGCPLTLGTDSHAVVDMFEEVRGLELHERLASGRRGHWTSGQLLAAATESGHRALGFPDAGRIAAGAWADLVSVGLDSVRTAGARTLVEAQGPAMAADAVVFAATAADVHSVVAGGARIVADGRHVRLPDVAKQLEAGISAAWTPPT
jgi:formiminoglutamate deiminase